MENELLKYEEMRQTYTKTSKDVTFNSKFSIIIYAQFDDNCSKSVKFVILSLVQHS